MNSPSDSEEQEEEGLPSATRTEPVLDLALLEENLPVFDCVTVSLSPAEEIRAQALALGFDAVGIAPPVLPDAVEAGLKAWLEAGCQGEMGWMAARAGERGQPRGLWGEVNAVVMVGQNYGPTLDPERLAERPERGVMSVYAQGQDYHDVMKRRLKALGRWMVGRFGGGVKVFVDTAPVMEKPLAVLAGLGWQGKHTNLVSRRFGSWLFLGAVFTTLPLPPDPPEPNRCGRCTRCLEVCPTAALTGAGQLEARRCIAYLTIEHPGPIPVALRRGMGNRVYGCDACLAVCPWNRFAQASREMAFWPRVEMTAPRLADLALLDDATFRHVFAGSPIKRIGRERMVRNALIGLGNSGETRFAPVARSLTNDSSPVVAEAATWTLALLSGRGRG